MLLHGLVAGPAKALEGFQRRGRPIEVKPPPGAPRPLWVRAGTSDILTHLEVIRQGEWDMPLRAGPPAVILDLGANIGLAAVWYASRYPGARIICVECEQANYDLLVRNTRSYGQIETLHAAVWSEPTTVTVTDPGEGDWGYRVAKDLGGPDVEALTIDGLMERFGLDHVDLVKMDVEGAEAAIFANPSAWIDRVSAIAVELHESIAPGCTAVFDRATSDFVRRSTRGPNVQVERR